MVKSTASCTHRKAANRKPHSDFPLWKHTGSGQWCKKLRGRFYYFGSVANDPHGEAALTEWLRVKDDLLAGRDPSLPSDGLTVAGLCNAYLTHKQHLLESSEITQRTFEVYHKSCGFLIASLGKSRSVEQLGPKDFQALRGRMAECWGPVRLKNEMGVVNSIFRYGDEAGLYEKRIRFGPAWVKPSAKTLRKNRASSGPRLFTPDEVQSLLNHATDNLRAMFLLGLNGGLGNTDLAMLSINAIDLETGWLDYPRPKTGIDRRIPLWPETVDATKAALDKRPDPKDSADESLLFIGQTGKNYVGNHRGYRVTAEFNRVAKRAKVEGRTFYDARRTFQTIGEEARDLVVVQSIMGHAAASGDMSAVYRQRISDERLKAVTDYVRNWLFGNNKRQQTDRGQADE